MDNISIDSLCKKTDNELIGETDDYVLPLPLGPTTQQRNPSFPFEGAIGISTVPKNDLKFSSTILSIITDEDIFGLLFVLYDTYLCSTKSFVKVVLKNHSRFGSLEPPVFNSAAVSTMVPPFPRKNYEKML